MKLISTLLNTKKIILIMQVSFLNKEKKMNNLNTRPTNKPRLVLSSPESIISPDMDIVKI
jgi:hypothetical protein